MTSINVDGFWCQNVVSPDLPCTSYHESTRAYLVLLCGCRFIATNYSHANDPCNPAARPSDIKSCPGVQDHYMCPGHADMVSEPRRCRGYCLGSTGRQSHNQCLGLAKGTKLTMSFGLHQDQQHLKLHLPEKLTCVALSPNGVWLAAGSPNGQIYLWEVSFLSVQTDR